MPPGGCEIGGGGRGRTEPACGNRRGGSVSWRARRVQRAHQLRSVPLRIQLAAPEIPDWHSGRSCDRYDGRLGVAAMSTATVTAPTFKAQSRSELRIRRLVSNSLTLLVGIIVALPLVLLLINSFNASIPGREAVYGVQNWITAFSDSSTMQSLWNSVALGATRTLIALPMAFGLAWLIARSDLPGRTGLEMLCWIGIFLPTLPLTF